MTATVVVCACGQIAKPPRRGMCNRCYERNRYRQNAYERWDPDGLDAEPVRQHVLDLLAAGVPCRKISRMSKVSRQQIAYLLRGAPAKQVSAKTAAALLGVVLDDVRPEGEELVSALGSQRRLRALVAAGWTIAALAAELGVGTASDLRYLIYHQKSVRHWKHQQITALFDRLQMVPGPSEQAREIGRQKRWPLPMQWDEDALDDPARGPEPKVRRSPYQKRRGTRPAA